MEYVDTNVIIYHLIGDSIYGENARSYLEKVAEGERHAVSSVYLFAEVYATLRMFKKTQKEIYRHLDDLSKIGIEFLDLNFYILRSALEEFKAGLKFGDAIHLKTMEEYDVNDIVSEDKDFDPIEGINRISLKKALKM